VEQINNLSFYNIKQMKKISVLFLFVASMSSLFAQEIDKQTTHTIKVQKKGQISSVQFDDVNYRLVGIDQYGNVLDSAVLEFKMSATVRGIFYSSKTIGPVLSRDMQQVLERCDQMTNLFFSEIKAKDRNGNIVDVPKFQYQLGFAGEQFTD
jgi:hypothetical protein